MSTEFDAPQSRAEAVLQNMLGANNELEPPQSRVEAILQNMLGANNELEPPQSREEQLLMLLLEQGGPGGEAVLINNKNISANGEYSASRGDADGYKKVTVSVPNTYAAGDEGKVVDNGALVAQTAHATVTENGTIDTTLNNSVEVAVPVPTLESKSVSANGTYTPESGKAWNEVVVSVVNDTSPYIIRTGTFTPASDGSSITIDATGITTLVYLEMHIPGYANYKDSAHDKMAVGYMRPNPDAFIDSAAFWNSLLFAIEMANVATASREEYIEFWSSGVTCTLSGGVITIGNNKGVTFKAGIAFNYVLVGV